MKHALAENHLPQFTLLQDDVIYYWEPANYWDMYADWRLIATTPVKRTGRHRDDEAWGQRDHCRIVVEPETGGVGLFRYPLGKPYELCIF